MTHADGATRPLRVLFDARMATRRRTGGARHIGGLQTALEADPGVTVLAVSGPPGFPRRNVLTTIGNLALDLAWTHVALPAIALARRVDVIHAPFNWAPLAAPVPVVVTIHDLSWEVLPDAYPRAFRLFARHFTRWSARRAAQVLTVSATTADDVIDRYGIPPSRVQVTYTGIPPRGSARQPRQDIVLTVGEFEPRKRVPELVAAHRAYWDGAADDPHRCRLVVVGSGGSDEAAVQRLAHAGCDVVGYVSEERLEELYRSAALTVSNSAFEGFGLPIAEAAGAGCAVLIADTPALREAGGPEALVVEHPGPEALTRALREALRDRTRLAGLDAAMRAHAARFTWSRCVADTLAAYRRAVS
ncbi:MAG: glycosyltransferase family 1 protein [Thermoleophilia bacterium]